MKRNYVEYKDKFLNQISPSFCGAKWYNATVWLGSGTTASCHHPPAHKIPLEEIQRSYKALHNTEYKKMVRKQMLIGERPTECEYCWKVEDLGADKISDRVYKSIIYSDEANLQAKDLFKETEDVDLKTLEIAFDANCNFACSYCNPSFSTKWMEDIKTNGPYQNMVSDGAGAYHQDGSWAQPYGIKNQGNPYVAAFMEWWINDLQHSLQELRITGGEATMSQDFWRLMDWWEKNPECTVNLAVNSNLGAKKQLIERLAEVSHKMKNFHLYTSNESVGAHAEYIRDGLKWDTWLENIEYMLTHGNLKGLHVMMTLNSLSLFSMIEFMDKMLELRQKHWSKMNNQTAVMSFNILRFPSFMSIVTLPQSIRNEYADKLEAWLTSRLSEVNNLIHEHEKQGIQRTIAYIREVEVGHYGTSSIESRERDFKTFYMQYDVRRKKNFTQTFPELAEWYNGIPVTEIESLQTLIEGDSTKNWKHVSELHLRAAKEGWVLNKQQSNPGSQDYKPTKKRLWDI
jgi:pyruvate-formate lyase-activating enzyme